jgi:hypothetical protein
MKQARLLIRPFLVLLSLLFLVANASAQQSEVHGASYIVEEKMLVKEGKEDWFVEYWKSTVLPVFAAMDGYMGYQINTTMPDPELTPEEENFGEVLPLGPPDRTFIPHGGIQLNGTVTNTMVHFGSMLRGTYNFTVVHYWRDAESLRGLLPQFGPKWKEVHGKGDPWKVLETEYFVNLENHWDTVYRIVE